MKAIKNLFISGLIVSFMIFSCKDDDYRTINLDTDFVRFSFFVDNNNQPFVYPQNAQNNIEQSSFVHQKRDTLRIPVALTSRSPQEQVSLKFDYFFNQISDNEIEILPANQRLQFTASQPSDTIYLIPQQRFDENTNASILLKLIEIDDPNIHLGYPRENNPLDEFTINILPTAPINYSLKEENFVFLGEENETHELSILFDQIVSPDELNDLIFLSGEFAQFACDDGLQITYDFDLNKIENEQDSKHLKYMFTALQEVKNFSSNLNINLLQVPNENFVRTGNALVNINRSVTEIERTGDIAKHWYDVTTNFHLTYGRAWYFNVNNNECRWQNFQSFTRPVEVVSGSEFDNGQGFHKYKIGFKNVIANPAGNIIGTNPFNFRRYYDGASTLSPAYNLNEAIEFFPNPEDNGATGAVSVINQTLVFIIGDNQIQVPICGNGTYRFNDDRNVWEMFVTIIADETEINGNSFVEKHLFVYSSNISGAPEDLEVDCSPYIVF